MRVATIDAARGQLLAWAGLAALNAVEIATLTMPFGGISVRLWHHAFAAGQLLGAGLLSAAAVLAWQRWAPARAWLGRAAIAVTALALSFALLRPALRGLAEQLKGVEGASAEPYHSLLCVLGGLSIPCAQLAGERLARPRLRWLAVAVAAGVAVANERVLEQGYDGIHVFAAWAAAVLAGTALAGATMPLPDALCDRRVVRAAGVPLGALAMASLLVWPPATVASEMYRLDGAVLLPLLAQAREPFDADDAAFEPAGEALEAQGLDSVPDDAIVILITIDAVRADVLTDPAKQPYVPNLRRLKARAVHFVEARTTSNFTRVALAGVFFGRYYSQIPWADPKSGRPVIQVPLEPSLPVLLTRAGVRTVNVVAESNAFVASAGIARGFSEEKVFPRRSQRRRDFEHSPPVMDEILARLRSHGDGPMFLFSHLMDPHSPYDAAGGDGPPLERWLREVALADGSVGRLMAELETERFRDRAVLIVAADHGESFGEHGARTHLTLYEEVARVPLLIATPGGAAREVAEPVSLIDLGPTILELLRQPIPDAFMGASLVPYLRGEDVDHDRPILMEAYRRRAMVTPDGMKVIVDRRRRKEEIFDLTKDPHENRNLRDTLGDRADALIDLMNESYAVRRTAPP